MVAIFVMIVVTLVFYPVIASTRTERNKRPAVFVIVVVPVAPPVVDNGRNHDGRRDTGAAVTGAANCQF